MNSKILRWGAFVAGFWLAAAGRTAAQGVAFTTNTYPVIGTPVSVAAVNINGDLTPDLVSANFNAGTLTIFTNNGSGIFGSNAVINIGSGSGPYFVAPIKINGDSNVDLISANYSANTLTVLTNNGKGVYSQSATLSAAVYNPVCVAVADFNGDGKPDLACANSTQSFLTVYLNNGAGGFNVSSAPGVGSTPEWVVAAKTKSTGYQDLITVNNGSASLTVSTNNGSGAFSTAATLNVGTSPVAVVAVNIKGNGGLPDLVSAIEGNSTLAIWTNNGSGTFSSNATLNLISAPTSLATGDFIGTGKPDLAVAEVNNCIQVFTNNGSGIFGSNTTVYLIGPQKSLVASVLNSTGLADLITANYSQNTLTVLSPDGVPRPVLSITHPSLNSLTVSWTSSYTNFVLQTNSNLTSTNWVPVTSLGTNQTMTITPQRSGNLFFRLVN